jgi:hypothetical protein
MVDVDISKLYLLTKRKSCSTLTPPPDKSTLSAAGGGGGTKLRKSSSTLVKHRSSVSEALFPDKATNKTSKAPPLPLSPAGQLDVGTVVNGSNGLRGTQQPPATPTMTATQNSLKVDAGETKARRGSTVAR